MTRETPNDVLTLSTAANKEGMSRTRRKGYVLAVVGAVWFGTVVFLERSNLIVRDTPLGTVAAAMDKLPLVLRDALFLVCWVIFFLGWALPIAYSVHLLVRAKKRANGQFDA